MQYILGPPDEAAPQVTYACATKTEANIAMELAENYWNLDVVAIGPSAEDFREERTTFVKRLGNAAMLRTADELIYTKHGKLVKITSERSDSEVAPVVRQGRYLSPDLFLNKVVIIASNRGTEEFDQPTIRKMKEPESVKPKKVIELKPNFEGALAKFESRR